MSIKVKVVLRKEKTNKSGTHPINIRITQNKRIKYFPTGISLPIDAWDDKNQRILPDYTSSAALQTKIDEKRLYIEKQIIRMEMSDDPANIDTVSNTTHKSGGYTIGGYFEKKISEHTNKGKIGTASKYRSCLSLLKKCNPICIEFDKISVSYINTFTNYLKGIGNKDNSIATKLSVLKAVYNDALREGIFQEKQNPFNSLQVGKFWKQTRKRAICKDDIQKVLSLNIPFNKATHSMSFARDIFLFSYLTAGMNFKDIAMLKYKNLQNGRIYYKRHKTGKEMTCILMNEARLIIDAYSVTNTDDEYIFPILNANIHKTEQQIYNRLHKVLIQVNHNLSVMGEILGLKVSLTTYVARHSYATVMKRSGVNIALISETLGHSDLKTTQIYLDSFENRQIDEAMKNLL